MIVARALSSTIIDTNISVENEAIIENEEDILTDWFEKYEGQIKA